MNESSRFEAVFPEWYDERGEWEIMHQIVVR